MPDKPKRKRHHYESSHPNSGLVFRGEWPKVQLDFNAEPFMQARVDTREIGVSSRKPPMDGWCDYEA